MTRLESTVGGIIANIIQKRVIPTNQDSRLQLAIFVSIQKLRTDAQRQQYFHFGELLRETLEKDGRHLPSSVLPPTTKQEAYDQDIRMIPGLTKSVLAHILNKT